MATIYTSSPAKVLLKGLTCDINDGFGPETPDDLLAAVTKLYSGVTVATVTEKERYQFIEDIKHTKLQTPLEFVDTVWLIQDVTRAFTHQLVRYRVGTSFVQESLRFVAKRELRVFLNKEWIDGDDLDMFQSALDHVEQCYNTAIQNDVPVQDARAILPTNVLTNVWFKVSLRSLANIYTQRWCCQAQEGEWRGVLEQMKEQLNNISPLLASFLQPPTPGRCGFGASFDRPCRLLQEQRG